MSEDTVSAPEVTIEMLHAEATELGIKFNPNIGVDKLQAKIDNAIAAQTELTDLAASITPPPAEIKDPVVETGDSNEPDIARTKEEIEARLPVLSSREIAQARKRKASELVRVNISCMNPNKKDWEGELISVGSPKVGTFKKFVLFNTENGYHIPHIMYQFLKERKCQIFQTVKDNRGNKMRKGKLINEFAIELLPELTKKELADLATQQALAGSID